LNGGLNNAYVGKNKVKGTTQMNGHFLKLHFCMFERSQMKHISFGLKTHLGFLLADACGSSHHLLPL